MIKVGINGFGRIGRVILRTCIQESHLEVTAINDPAVDIDYICYLIKFDSTHGKFKGQVTSTVKGIIVNGKTINIFHEKIPSNIPWRSAEVEYVIEASGMFTNYEKAMGHLASETVKRVIVTAPSVDIPMLILGVNEHDIHIDDKIMSCASSTLYCLAPIINILEQNYGVSEGFITSIHAMTPSLKPLDGLCLRGKHWRDHRSIHQNIIPAATGACKALGKIIPQVKDKMNGIAFRVPIVNVSVLDITIRLKKNVSIEDIFKSIDIESQTSMKNIIKLCTDEAVSSDFLGDEHSCTLDVKSSLQLTPNFFKLICWYENEYSYACRVVDSIKYSEKSFHAHSMSNITSTSPLSKRLFQQKSSPYCRTNCFQNNNLKSKLASVPMKFNKPIILRQNSNYQNSNPVTCAIQHNTCILKNWNNEAVVDLPLVRDNKNALFHSCVTFEQYNLNPLNYTKNQERLQKVKQEVSKMIDMTEVLLKKVNLSSTNDIDNENTSTSKENSDDHKICNANPKKSTKDQVTLVNNKSIEFDKENKNNIVEYENTGTVLVPLADVRDQCLSKEEILTKDKINHQIEDCTLEVKIDNNKEPITSNIINVSERIDNHECKPGDRILLKDEISTEVMNDPKKITVQGNKKEIRKKILEGIMKKLSLENTSNSTTDTTRKECSNNIYDKLDSASNTDSENSFLINEKKSQVLDLNELTNSAEDLSRLDKICRIIEISDELSDKLFSALDENQSMKNKEWSFKDLCERLKLDEFCNDIWTK